MGTEPLISLAFADDTTTSLTALGSAHLRLCAEPPASSADGMLLHTCQRIEWYAGGDCPAPASELVGRPRLAGRREILTRLAQIDAGARSLIPGERFIHHQLAHAVAQLPHDHPLSVVGQDALELGQRARERFHLHAPVDYSDLPRLLLDQRQGDDPRQLLVVGGGMLARAIAAAPPPGCERVVMMTRNPRKLRRRLEGLRHLTIVRAPSLARALGDRPFNVVIATTNLNTVYQQQISTVACAARSRTVIDLCCTPVLDPRPARYHHLYDADVLRVLQSANREVAQRAVLARQWIADNAEAYV